MMTLASQFELFLYSFLIGIYLGVTYDLLYYFIFINANKYVRAFFDIVFFVCQGFIVFNIIYKLNNGIIPFYCYLIFALGFLIYYRFQDRYYEKRLTPLRKAVYRLTGLLGKVLNYLFVKPFVDTYRFFWGIIGFFIKIGKGRIQSVKSRLRSKKEQKATS